MYVIQRFSVNSNSLRTCTSKDSTKTSSGRLPEVSSSKIYINKPPPTLHLKVMISILKLHRGPRQRARGPRITQLPNFRQNLIPQLHVRDIPLHGGAERVHCIEDPILHLNLLVDDKLLHPLVVDPSPSRGAGVAVVVVDDVGPVRVVEGVVVDGGHEGLHAGVCGAEDTADDGDVHVAEGHGVVLN